jgi:hypothetical protein
LVHDRQLRADSIRGVCAVIAVVRKKKKTAWTLIDTPNGMLQTVRVSLSVQTDTGWNPVAVSRQREAGVGDA